MAGLYQIGGAYLKAQTSVDNGGIAGVLLDNIDFSNGQINTNKIQNVSLWTTYIKGFLMNTTRLKPVLQDQTYQFNNLTSVSNPSYGFTIGMIIWLSTFLILTLALIAIMICQCLKDKRFRNVAESSKSKRRQNLPNPVGHKKRKRTIIMVCMGLTIVVWLVFMILLCISQYLVSTQLNNNNSSNNANTTTKYSSIKDSATMSFNYLNNFFNIITNQTSFFIASSLSSLSDNTRNQLTISITAFGNQVLATFNITSLFNTTNTLINRIDQVVNSMNFINDNCQNILTEVDNLKGSVNVYRNNLQSYLGNICPSLTDNTLKYSCNSLQAKTSFFEVRMQSATVSSSSSVIMLFVLRQYNINITNIMTTFHQVNSDFQTKLNMLFNSTVDKFDISSYLAFMPTMWAKVIEAIGPSLSTAPSYNTTINSYIDTASKYENLVIVILMLLIIMTVVVLLSSFRDSVQKRFLNRCLSSFVQILFIFVLVLSAVVCILILTVANFTQSEACNQINTTNGVNLLDQIMNDKFSDPWKWLVNSVSGSIQNIDITLNQPINILSGVRDRCNNSSMGLLSVLGIKNIVNITKLIRSSSIMTMVAKAETDSLNAFLGVKPQQMIPQDMMSFVTQTTGLVAYFDGINYSNGIEELQKPLVGIIDFDRFFMDLSIFAMNTSKYIGWTSDLRYLNDTANQLSLISPNISQLQTKVNNLTLNFQTLQRFRDNGALLNQLVGSINSVVALFNNPSFMASIFSSIYNATIKINLTDTVEQIVTNGINTIFTQVFPCNDLSSIYEAITTGICSGSNLNAALATFGIILLIVIVLDQTMAIIILASISLRIN